MFNKGDKVVSTNDVKGVVIGTGRSKSVYHVLVENGDVIAYEEEFLSRVEENPKEEKKTTTKTKKSPKKKAENDK